MPFPLTLLSEEWTKNTRVWKSAVKVYNFVTTANGLFFQEREDLVENVKGIVRVWQTVVKVHNFWPLQTGCSPWRERGPDGEWKRCYQSLAV